MKVHELKCWPEYFYAIWTGQKRFEVRENDRDFKVGELLYLREFDPQIADYTGNAMSQVRITYVMQGGLFGVDPDYVVLGIAV